MRAVYFENQTLTMLERPRPAPGAGMALLQLRMAGICNTDVELFSGYYGYKGVPGHECVAEVVEAPDAPHWLGRRVVVDINYACRTCPVCAAGRHRHCPKRTVLGIVGGDGAFADFCLAPVANLVEVPESLPDEAAVFAELLAAALEPGQQCKLSHRDRLLIVGDGKLGLLAALGLRYQCPDLVLAGRHADKLAIAAAVGVRTELVTSEEGLAPLVRRNGLFDVVIEAGGRPETLAQALHAVRPEGTVVAKTTSHLPTQVDMAKVVVDEITVLGSRCGDMELAVRYLANGWVDPRPLIRTVLPFAEFEKAFALARTPGALKVLVRW
jgi:threonine dehydrogenase-like Zn-dependent dehydrogenase